MKRQLRMLDPRRIGKDAEKLQAGLFRLVIGQNQAMQPILELYQMYLAGLHNPKGTIGNILMLGPTGTGKTRTVEAIAQTLFNTDRALIKIDCGEFQHSQEIAKLIGSPPGYLGHRETHPLLSQEVINQHHTDTCKISLILFDEIEKASDALWNLMLGILDKAVLTLGDNRKVNFSRAMIFCTSNVGAEPMLECAEAAMRAMKKGKEIDRSLLERDIFKIAFEAAKSKFPPEFINRFNRITGYAPLFEGELLKIVDLALKDLRARIRESKTARPFSFDLSKEAKLWLVEHGANVRMGGRELNRVIERVLVVPMSNLIATNQIEYDAMLYVDVDIANDLEMPFSFGVETTTAKSATQG